MDNSADQTKKLRTRLRRYERQLRREYEAYGAYDDSGGLRYEIGPLYLRLGDVPGALQAFTWFKEAFPEDSGEPGHSLCWTLALYRAGEQPAATQKLRETMLANLYLLPHLLGLKQDRLAIWHGSNWAEPEYAVYVCAEWQDLWDAAALEWARAIYDSPEVRQVRERAIEISRQLKTLTAGPRRTRLVKEAYELRGFDIP